MKKQELCQLLELELLKQFNRLIINNIANYLMAAINKDSNLKYSTIEQLRGSSVYQNWIQKLKEGIPIQYVLHTSCFYGIDLEVNDDVLIPRPETEELVFWILSDFKSKVANQVLDIGTGSGCISIALKVHRPDWEITGIDISEAAINVAIRNALNYNLDIQFVQTDFIQNKNSLQGTYDLIVSNPPYISKLEVNNIPDSVLSNEPVIALFPPGDDPLIFYKEIALWAIHHLGKTGSMYFEMNEFLFNETQLIFQRAGYSKIEVREDLQGKKRMLKVQF